MIEQCHDRVNRVDHERNDRATHDRERLVIGVIEQLKIEQNSTMI